MSLVIFTDSDFTKALEGALRFFPHKWLKPEQKLCLKKLVNERKDVLGVPIGYGKFFFIYQLLPKISQLIIFLAQFLHTATSSPSLGIEQDYSETTK